MDAMISVIAHELSETVTDPLLSAWYDANGEEVADKCAWTFGTTFAAPNGSTANITLGSFDFLIQQEFSNASDSCVMSYNATPNYTLSVSPPSQSAGQNGTTGNYTVTVNPTNGFSSPVTFSVTGLPAGAIANPFSPNPASTTSAFNISAGTAAAAGTYALTITGVSGNLSHTAQATLVVTQPDFSLSVSPSSQTVVQGATTAESVRSHGGSNQRLLRCASPGGHGYPRRYHGERARFELHGNSKRDCHGWELPLDD